MSRKEITSDIPSSTVEHAKIVHAYVEAHPQWKRQHVADRPKGRNKCGGCAGFRTHFCTWNTRDGPGVTEDDDACGNYYARPRIKMDRQFEKAVANL